MSAINFTEKDAAGLEMFGLVFQETHFTLPLCASGILKPISSSHIILGVIFHGGYKTER